MKIRYECSQKKLCERRLGGSLSLRWWDPSAGHWRWREIVSAVGPETLLRVIAEPSNVREVKAGT